MRDGEEVSVYADILGKCLKGYTGHFEGQIVFLGNGITKKSRASLFECAPNFARYAKYYISLYTLKYIF